MALSWNEIKERAVLFSKEWADTFNEEAEAKSFIEAFFNVFGITRKRVGTFEHRVKKLNDADGYIDLLWKGTILIEMKSKGKNLDKAFIQAKDYIHGLKEHELPKYILVSDFENFRLFDTEENKTLEFKLNELVNYVQHFGFIAGYQKRIYKEQDPVNIKAAELMGKLHDRLEEIGYTGHPLEVYLVRILFCLFAEDTTIFDKHQFQHFIEDRTNEDGSDLAAKIQELFQVLNTPHANRFKNLDEQLNAFPYVNGKLFEEILPSASFDSAMRNSLLECCYIDWSKISPAIFGSMFQSVMNPQERRNLGAHYTSEKNILKLIKPLFLDDLYAEFEAVKKNRPKLQEFHKKISQLKFLDPACGCGNFLVITYRELRLLEIEILREQYKNQLATSIASIIWLNVDMMYGIEYEEFPARIAEVAMWLMDHQMNMLISNEFGEYFARLPLEKAAKIVHGNALTTNWHSLLFPLDHINVIAEQTNIFILEEPIHEYNTVNILTNKSQEHKLSSIKGNEDSSFDFILGNPPFLGKSNQNVNQKAEMSILFNGVNGAGVLDYVCAWYLKAAQFIQNTKTKVAFVSTNSISQGEQVGILWELLFRKYNIKIHFAHRTFSWNNEARGNAAVHCVIIGFANFDTNNKRIFEYENIKGEPHEIRVKNINPYLVEGKDFTLSLNEKTICDVPKIAWGNKPVDGGNLIISDKDLGAFLTLEPKASKFIKPLISAKEFLNGEKRWCIWLVDASPEEIKQMPYVLDRIKNVKKIRENSIDEGARKLALKPTQFRDIRNPESYILIPSTTSENRKYIPFAFFKKDNIPHNSCHILPDGNLYHFGILMSLMHMAWVKTTCGRLKSDYRYSKDIVYNNYPWPENPSEKQIQQIEEKAQKVLDVRAEFPNSSLANLYNPLTMPPALVKAHNELDKAVDLAYRPQPFLSEAKRMEFLFELYEKYTADLFTKEKPKRVKKTA
ncbi:class I SAM-dependent DNA methyltransferase [Pedobacter aquae]|uniref:site-specific DNA-methyltransferase (adenine-specific) n=1 Tax=Pedobacter aquae TaxID=2605747 RepID=A0A5C0VNK8_9SPHI|nr:DNA methyltransferase [Pedobacter aquae]QEK53121.1 class I SAM-dependent DNA methyltransferase [Pedobacter aquae]